jgi:hypothetical protein
MGEIIAVETEGVSQIIGGHLQNLIADNVFVGAWARREPSQFLGGCAKLVV